MDKHLFNFIKTSYVGGLCDTYKKEIWGCVDNKEKLARLAMRQQSIPFVTTMLAKSHTTKEQVVEFFNGYINGVVLHNCDKVEGYTYCWYVDYNYDNDIVANVDVINVSFTVGANIVVPKTKCPTIYVGNRSNIHLVCEGFNSVKVYLFDKSQLTIEDADEESDVTVFKYSDECRADIGKYCLAKVKTHNKELRL